MGSAHLKCIADGNVDGMVVGAVCDIDGEKRRFSKKEYPDIPVFENYGELLEKADIDAVIIAVPHPLHSKISISAFEYGKHVLVEKPVDISVTNAKRLNEAAKSSGRVFGIMLNQRTNGLFLKARELIKSGGLGELKRCVWIITNWYRTDCYYASGGWRATWQGEGGGVLINQAPHNLDLWQWICGLPKSVTAFCNAGKFHNIEVEDEATIYAEYENGATGVFITSTGDLPGTNRLEISGTKGKIVLENGLLKHWRLKEDERSICKNALTEFVKADCEYLEYTCEKESGHRGILQNFANAALFGEELIASGYEGINELMLSNAAYFSQWTGNKKISLPFDEAEFDRLMQEKRSYERKKNSEPHFSPLKSYDQRWKTNW